MIATRHEPETAALTGVAIVLAFYALVGGRVFCSWVCPVNQRGHRHHRVGVGQPVSLTHSALIFGTIALTSAVWLCLGGVFLFDLFAARRR